MKARVEEWEGEDAVHVDLDDVDVSRLNGAGPCPRCKEPVKTLVVVVRTTDGLHDYYVALSHDKCVAPKVGWPQ